MRRLATGFTPESSGPLYLSKFEDLVGETHRRRREKMLGGVRVWGDGGV
jgi:hypothetical protein